MDKLTELVRKALGDKAGKPFRPCAFFNEPLDAIFVIIKDCSHKEVRINDSLVMLEDNYPGRGDRYVGFEIIGVRHFCRRYEIECRGTVDLEALLGDMWLIYPCPTKIKDEICRMLIQVQTVELPD